MCKCLLQLLSTVVYTRRSILIIQYICNWFMNKLPTVHCVLACSVKHTPPMQCNACKAVCYSTLVSLGVCPCCRTHWCRPSAHLLLFPAVCGSSVWSTLHTAPLMDGEHGMHSFMDGEHGMHSFDAEIPSAYVTPTHIHLYKYLPNKTLNMCIKM